MSFESSFVALFVVATLVTLAARRLRMPYTVALVLAGLVIGTTHVLQPPHLTKALLYSVFLPGLIFEASFHLDTVQFRRNVLTIGALAVPGMLLSGLLIALLLGAAHVAPGFGFLDALLFAALIVATDPIAVTALFKTLGAPERLATLVEGESIFNDGAAVAFYTVVLAAAAGGHMTLGGAVRDFVMIAGLGLMLGAAVGALTSRFLRKVDDPMIAITVTVIAAYASFIAAESLHASGVIATATAGLLAGEREVRVENARRAVGSFWAYVAFALNSVVFLLIGLEVSVAKLLGSWRLIAIAWLIVTGVRMLLVSSMFGALRSTRARVPWSWTVVLGWGGLRGALSMVLALSLPPDFAYKSIVETMTFGVVVVSILVQGLTMTPLLRWLRIGPHASDATQAKVVAP